jgi:hypothetical protein
MSSQIPSNLRVNLGDTLSQHRDNSSEMARLDASLETPSQKFRKWQQPERPTTYRQQQRVDRSQITHMWRVPPHEAHQ